MRKRNNCSSKSASDPAGEGVDASDADPRGCSGRLTEPAQEAYAGRGTRDPRAGGRDLRHLPFADAVFDGVWAAAPLLHLKRYEVGEALGGLRRVLKPGALPRRS